MVLGFDDVLVNNLEKFKLIESHTNEENFNPMNIFLTLSYRA